MRDSLTNIHSFATTDVSLQPDSSDHDNEALHKPSNSQLSSCNVSRGRSRTKKNAKQPSDSTKERGSHNSTKPFVHRPSSKSIERDRQLKKIQAMAYTSILSPYFPRHVSLERPYYRPLSPTTRQFFDEHVFYPSSNPNRFQDVLSTNRCLRCFSSNHEGKSCTVFDYPTPRICPFCRFLYHDEQDCIYKDEHIYDSDLTDLSSTPSSRSSSPLSSSLPTSRSMTPTHFNENVHYDVHYSNIHDAYNYYQHGYNEYQSSSFCFSPDLNYPY